MSDDGEAIKNSSRDAFKGRITVKDIARELCVSIATASRAISNDPTIAKRTRERVLAKTAEMGYEPNLFARGLITNKSKIAVLSVTNLTNPFYPDVVVRLSRRLQGVGSKASLTKCSGFSHMSPLPRRKRACY
ncbi:MAG: LacI family transcriptional regulator [Candidatus Brocadiia bacterium]|jgi:DNA-binding LacI/PurR family transcriptional regulator|nr:MAG: LacI family transcriptional regulator [Candidatus Brocadiia bacterium]